MEDIFIKTFSLQLMCILDHSSYLGKRMSEGKGTRGEVKYTNTVIFFPNGTYISSQEKSSRCLPSSCFPQNVMFLISRRQNLDSTKPWGFAFPWNWKFSQNETFQLSETRTTCVYGKLKIGFMKHTGWSFWLTGKNWRFSLALKIISWNLFPQTHSDEH